LTPLTSKSIKDGVKVSRDVIISRREKLAKLLQSHRYLSLAKVCDSLKISAATARRDLRALAGEEQITRTYGGALSKFDRQYASFFLRKSVDAEAKELIAQKAFKLIHPEMACFFDSGTTVFAVAEALQRQPVHPLSVVTNNLPVADTLGRFDDMEVNILGGRFLQRQSIMLGEEAEVAAQRWEFDLAFMGCEGLTEEGIWASGPEVASLQKVILGQAKKLVVCAHGLKIGVKTQTLLTPWLPKIHLMTDVDRSRLKAAGLPTK
jgi:DeoR/GlpR family transcriptional regulator of sugar metabolism